MQAKGAFQLTRTAGGKIPTQRKSREDFPVVKATRNLTYSYRGTDDQWVTGATMLPAVADKVMAQLKARGRKRGTHYRFTVAK